MRDAEKMVREFHEACGGMPEGFGNWIDANRQLRRELIREEFFEFSDAEDKNDIVAVADALADLIYVIVGTAIEYNIPIVEVFEEVHRSNMTKFIDGWKREDGKHMKGESYTPADVRGVLQRRGLL